MSGAFVASFPPGRGGLSSDEVAHIVGTIDDSRMSVGKIGSFGGRAMNTSVRSGNVQWIPLEQVDPAILSHLYSLATVANRERGWNFQIEGLTPNFQATSYAADEAEHYDWHMDWGGGAMAYRKISVIVHLSDPADFDGGSLQLTIGSTPMEAIQTSGSVTIFPSFVLHRVTPVTRGRRLGVVSWVLGRPFA